MGQIKYDKVCKWAKVSQVLMYSCKIIIFLNHHDWKYTEVAVSPPLEILRGSISSSFYTRHHSGSNIRTQFCSLS